MLGSCIFLSIFFSSACLIWVLGEHFFFSILHVCLCCHVKHTTMRPCAYLKYLFEWMYKLEWLWLLHMWGRFSFESHILKTIYQKKKKKKKHEIKAFQSKWRGLYVFASHSNVGILIIRTWAYNVHKIHIMKSKSSSLISLVESPETVAGFSCSSEGSVFLDTIALQFRLSWFWIWFHKCNVKQKNK